MIAYSQAIKRGLFWRSRDGGRTWKQENVDIPIVGEAYFTVLRDGTLFIAGYGSLHRSTDGGKSWETHTIRWQDLPGLTEPKSFAHSYNIGELHDGTLIYVAALSNCEGDYILRSKDKGKTWDPDPQKLRFRGGIDPKDMGGYGTMFGETFLWQAPNGDILALARVLGSVFPLRGMNPPPMGSDHSEGLALYRSKDDGASWTVEEFGGYYGEMYSSLLRLQDGRLLLTFTLRAAIAPQKPPLGVRAVVGKETHEGFEFDFQHDRIMLDTKTPIGQYSGGGFGNTVQLDDGTLVTCYSYADADKWETNPFHVEVVRWRLP